MLCCYDFCIYVDDISFMNSFYATAKTCVYGILAAVRFVHVLKLLLYAFLCHCHFCALLKYVSMPLLWCRMVGRIPLYLWEVNGVMDLPPHFSMLTFLLSTTRRAAYSSSSNGGVGCVVAARSNSWVNCILTY